MPLDLTVLDDAVPAPAGGAPLELPIDTIDEDPEQPRFEFDDQPLAELAETIRERGVRQPVSVRPHPEQPGRWMLNFGARRLRASRMAGRQTVPAFVDLAADSYDQVIENEQRQNLQPLELALFVQRRMRAGETQAEVAARLGKSRGYLTFIAALIDPPDLVMELYRSCRCRGLAELYELRRLHEAQPDAVAAWLASGAEVTRAAVQRLKEDLRAGEPRRDRLPADLPRTPALAAAGRSPSEPPAPAAVTPPPPEPSVTEPEAEPVPSGPPSARDPRELLQLLATLGDEEVVVILDALPRRAGHVFVSLPDGIQRAEVEMGCLAQLRLVRALV